MCILQPCANPTRVGVWWRDDTQWCLYGANHQAQIRKGIASQLQQIDLGTIFSPVHPEGARYVVNLSQMDQVAVSSGQRRPVMVIDTVSVQTPQLEAPPQAGQPVLSDRPPIEVIAEVPWDAAAMASLAAKADKCLRRNILVMVIDRFRSDDHLDTILPVKACPWTVVSKSTSTCPTALYEKFVDSVEEILHTFPDVDLMGELIKIARSEEVGSGPIQVAFKQVERSGGSSSKHRSDVGTVSTKTSFWMSMAAPAAAAHAVVYGCTVQILAYLVILPTHTSKNISRKLYDCSGYVEVDRLEHQLPLAEVTVR